MSGNGGWHAAHCPAHPDERPSLFFRDGDRGVIVKCHAGCAPEAIVAALDLQLQDLFHDHGRQERRVVVTYNYRDERGDLLSQVLRYEPKRFTQRRPDGHGGWSYSLDGVRRILYRLPELIAEVNTGRVAFIVEGERDVDALREHGLIATTNPGGAGKWREEYTQQLKAAGANRAVILPDNDKPGEAHAFAVARSCLAAGLQVKIVRLSGLPPKGDVSDWLNAGHTKEELAEAVEAASTVTEADLEMRPPETRGLPLVPLRDLLNEPDEDTPWLVDQHLPASGLSLLAGKPKAGKSTLARCLALAVARGTAWLGFSTQQATVYYLGLEEKRGEVRNHFKAMGATVEAPVKVFISPSPRDGLAQLRQAAEQERPGLIIVDPLLKLVRVKDANDYAAITQALEPLLALARDTGAHVLAVHHLGKGERSGGDAILGSTAIFAAVDTALILKRSERYRTLCSIQRYGEDLEEITLSLDPKTRVVSAGVPRREADEAEAAKAILEGLAGKPEPLPEADVHDAVEGRKAVKERALRRLVEEKKVVRTGAGKRGDPYRYAISPSLPPPHIRAERIRAPRGDGAVTAADVLARVLKAGGRVIPDPVRPRLLVPRDLRPLVAEHREALRRLILSDPADSSHTLEARVKHIVGMPLDRFAVEGSPLEVRVPWLPVTLWFVPSEADAEALAREGVSRGRVWTTRELMDLLAIPGLTPEHVRTVAQAKLEFAGEVVEVRPRRTFTPARGGPVSPTPIPSLDQLAADPGRARELPPAVARDLLVRLVGLQTLLLARALSVPAGWNGQPEGPADGDRLARTTSQIAKSLGLRETYVRELCRRGAIPASKPGKVWLIRPDALREWLLRHEQGQPARPAALPQKPSRARTGPRLDAIPANSRAERHVPVQGT